MNVLANVNCAGVYARNNATLGHSDSYPVAWDRVSRSSCLPRLRFCFYDALIPCSRAAGCRFIHHVAPSRGCRVFFAG